MPLTDTELALEISPDPNKLFLYLLCDFFFTYFIAHILQDHTHFLGD